MPDLSTIWDRVSLSDLPALKVAAERHGLSIFNLRSELPQQEARDRSVVALGSESRRDGDVYAKLTGREYQSVDEITELASLENVDIVATTCDRVTPELLELMEFIGGESTPGLLLTEHGAISRRAWLSALAAYSPVSNGDLVICSDGVTHSLSDGRHHCEQIMDARTIRSWLTRPVGLLALQTHSDGFDAKIVDELALCSRIEWSMDLAGPGLPRCGYEGWCHRFDQKLGDPRLTDKLMRMTEVDASIFIFDACWGFYPPEGTSLAAALFSSVERNHRISAFVAPSRLGFSHPGLLDGLIRNVSGGMPLGRALTIHNRSAAASNVDHAMSLLGDPFTRLGPAAQANLMALNSVQLKVAERSGVAAISADELLENWREEVDRRRASIPTRATISRFSSCENGEAKSREADDLLDSIARSLPRIDFAWAGSHLASKLDVGLHECLPAGTFSRIAHFRLAVEGKPELERVISLCQRCGVAQDLDPHLRIFCRPRPGNEFRFECAPESPPTQILLAIAGQQRLERMFVAIDLDERAPVTVEVPRAHRYDGLSYLSFVALRDRNFSVFQYIVNAKSLEYLRISLNPA